MRNAITDSVVENVGLRDTLLRKLISSELRVKDAEWIVETV